MLLAVPLLQMIPTAALSALLIGVGIKLAHPKEFKHAYTIGKEQLLVFVVTVVFTLGVDLLVGIAAGIITEFVVNLINGKPLNRAFKANVEVVDVNDSTILFRVNEAAVFSNFMGIKKQLYSIEGGKLIQIDCSNCNLLDHSAMENIHLFEHDYAHTGGRVELIGLHNHRTLSNHNLSARKRK
jgi:MFS superfamily sulfate permease-like transporter